MTFGQFVSILRARWQTAFWVVAALVAVTVGVSLVMPKTYTATASVVLDLKPDPISAAAYGVMTSPAYMATQFDILKSDRVSQRVVQSLRLNDDLGSRENWMQATQGKGNFDAWLATQLRKGMEIKLSRESNVINVEYLARDPKFAAQVANAYVQAYADTVRDIRVDPAKQYSAFFDTRAKQLQADLEKAQAKLSAYQKQKGIVATDERLDAETARLNELSAQIVMTQALAAESSSRQAAAQGRSADQMQDVLLNPVIGSLKSNLTQQEARLQELNSRLGENHPMVIESKANIASLRARLQSETVKVTSGVGVTNSINRQREAEIRGAYEAQRQKVLRLKEQRDEAAVFLREVDNAQKAYDGVMARLNQTALESQSNTTNVVTLNSATEPSDPSSPKLLRNTLMALVGGTLLALGLVLVLELMNRKVRSLDDVTQLVGVPVIGVMPGPDKQRMLGRKVQPLLARRVLGQLPMPNTRRA
jgi:chain length determinant protein EpsF